MHGRWAWGVIVAVALAACGGDPVTPGAIGAPDQGTGTPVPTGEPGSGSTGTVGSSDTDGTTGTSDGPVTVTVGGATHGYGVGTCDVTSADDVHADAATSMGSFQYVNVAISDDTGATMRAIVPVAGDSPPMQLFAGDPMPDTSWVVRVDGTTAVIDARMFDESPGAGDDPFHDVTITIRCVERGFGGMAPPTEEAPLVFEEPDPTPTPTGAIVTVDLGGTISTYEYFGCPLTEPAIMFVVLDVSGTRLGVVNGEARIDLPDGTGYRTVGVAFAGSSSSATWSGTMNGPAGAAPASITITC